MFHTSEVKAMTKEASGIAIHCAHDELVDITEIIPNPRNPNKHGDKQIALLAKIIRHQGWRAPIVVSNRSGFIVAGHGRLEAAKLLGVELVPVNRQDFATEADEWAHVIADNRIAELAETDGALLKELLKELDGKIDMDLSGFDAVELERVMDSIGENPVDAEPQIDRAAELQKEWGTATGQLWVLGEHRVLCGDSTKREDVERVMGGALAGLCFTSPPYGQQRDYGAKIDDWDGLMRGVFGNIPIDDAGQVIVNLGMIHRDGEWQPYWQEWIEWMRGQGWKRFGWYVWDQGPGMPGDWAGRLAPSHEFIFHFNRVAKKPAKTRDCKHAGARHGGKGQRAANGIVKQRSAGRAPVQDRAIADSVIRVNRQGARHDGHPAPFPPELCVSIFKSWDGIVFDPFLGSGTTLIAAEGLGRKCYGLEISPGYCAVILQRFKDATGKTPTLTPC